GKPGTASVEPWDRHVDDDPSTALLLRGEPPQRLAAEEGAGKIRIEDGVPSARAQIDGGGGKLAARIVHQNIDIAIFLACRLEEAGDLVRLANVAAEAERGAAGRPDRLRDFLERRVAAPADHDIDAPCG